MSGTEGRLFWNFLGNFWYIFCLIWSWVSVGIDRFLRRAGFGKVGEVSVVKMEGMFMGYRGEI